MCCYRLVQFFAGTGGEKAFVVGGCWCSLFVPVRSLVKAPLGIPSLLWEYKVFIFSWSRALTPRFSGGEQVPVILEVGVLSEQLRLV